MEPRGPIRIAPSSPVDASRPIEEAVGEDGRDLTATPRISIGCRDLVSGREDFQEIGRRTGPCE